MVVTMTMSVMVIAIIKFNVPSFSSVKGSNEASVNICYFGVVCGWDVASVV